MSEADAEWFDPSSSSGPDRPRPIGPNNPPPRPLPSTTIRPRWGTGGGGRRRCRNPPCRPREAPDRNPPPSNQSITIAISVVGALFLLLLVLLLLYMFVLKKKLRKVKEREASSQYGLRVEDVTHLDVDDSAKLYVNTTDLQRLVSSVRLKNKRPPPSTPVSDSDDGNYPDVVRVGRPPVPLPDKSPRIYDSLPRVEPYESPEAIYANVGESPPPVIAPIRPAPPLPSAGTSSRDSSGSPSLSRGSLLPKIPSKSSVSSSRSTPDPKPQPVSMRISQDSSTYTPPIARPRIPPPSAPSASSKPSVRKTDTPRPSLPRLKMNLIPTLKRQDSGFSTPDTAISYVAAVDTPEETPSFEPRTMSVKERKAILEGAGRQ